MRTFVKQLLFTLNIREVVVETDLKHRGVKAIT